MATVMEIRRFIVGNVMIDVSEVTTKICVKDVCDEVTTDVFKDLISKVSSYLSRVAY